MAKSSAAIIVAIFIVLLGVNGEKNVRDKRDTVEVVTNFNILDWLCQNNAFGLDFSWCTTTTAPPTTTSPSQTSSSGNAGSASGSTSSSTMSPSTSSTTPPSPLQNAHWCRLSNGSYLALSQTYMQMPCLMCQCVQNRNVVCNSIQCMATYCIDGSTPQTPSGQCCPQCAYNGNLSPCNTPGGITLPSGAIVTSQANGTQCWCQSGSIECRRTSITTVTTTWEYFNNTTTIYIIVVVICLILLLGTLLACGCGLLYYYYYQGQQQAIQQAYEQYYNNAGWQPMGEEGQVADAEKQAEAQQGQFDNNNYATGYSPEFIPPPYAVYSGPYGSEEDKKQQV